jgi:Ca2+-binding RTX toxin-like protein
VIRVLTHNRINALGGNDTVWGDGSHDTLNGGVGDDLLNGGAGTDDPTGGFGADRFVFSSVTDSVATAGLRDIIADFAAAADRIDLSAIDANTVTLNKQGFTWLGTGAITGAGQLNMAFDAATGHTLIRGNVNADLAPDFVIMLAGDYTASLTATDFLLG